MNSTFKVVFNKARGALMVVNEVTSSVQAKGTKTVVATAVAAMIAGTAAAAGADVSIDGSLTYAPKVDGSTVAEPVYKAEGTVKKGDTAWAAESAVAADDTIKFVGTDSKFSLLGNEGWTTAVEQTIAGVKGSGTIELQASNGKAGVAKTDGTDAWSTAPVAGANTTLTTGNIGTEAGKDVTVHFLANVGEQHKEGATPSAAAASGAATSTAGVATLQGVGTANFTLGKKETVVDGAVTELGSVVNLVVDEGSKAVVAAASDKVLTLANVSFANAGDLELSGQTVFLWSDYNGKSEENAGKLKVTSTGNSQVKGTFEDTVILVGSALTEEQAKAREEVKTHFDVQNVQLSIGSESTLKADTLYVNTKKVNVQNGGAVEAGAAEIFGNGSVDVAKKASFTATALKLNGGTIKTVAGDADNAAGTVTVEEGLTVAGTNTIANQGKFTAKTVAFDTKDASAKLTISDNTAGNGTGFFKAETIDVIGTGTLKTAELVINTTARADANNDKQYNVRAGELNIGANGTVDLQKGQVRADNVTVAKDGKLQSAEGTFLRVKEGLVLEQGAVLTSNAGNARVGYLTNDTAAKFGALTIVGEDASANNAKLEVTTLKIESGEFVNAAVKAGTDNNVLDTNLKASNLVMDGGSFTNAGIVAVTNAITLNKGATYTSALAKNVGTTGKSTTTAAAINVAKGAQFVIDGLNAKSAATATANDQLDLSASAWDIYGGTVDLKDGDITQADVIVKTFKVNGGDQTFKNLTNADSAAVEIKGDAYVTVTGAFNATKGTTQVTAGELEIGEEGKLYTNNNLTVARDGALYVNAAALQMTAKKVGTDYTDVEFAKGVAADKPQFKGITKNDGLIFVDASGLTLKDETNIIKIANATDTGSLLGQGGDATGLVYMTGMTFTDSALVRAEKLTTTQANGLNGFVFDQLSGKTVSAAANDTLRGEFANVEFAAGTAADSVIKVENILILNGAGNLVGGVADATHEATLGGISLETDNAVFGYNGRGEAGTIGDITGTGNIGTVEVIAGTLNAGKIITNELVVDADEDGAAALVAKSVKVNSLDIDGNLTVNGDLTTQTVAAAGHKDSIKGDLLVDGVATFGNNVTIASDSAVITHNVGIANRKTLTLTGNLAVTSWKDAAENVIAANLDGTVQVEGGSLDVAGTYTGSMNIIKDGVAVLNKVDNDLNDDINVGQHTEEGATEATSSAGTLFVTELVNGEIYADPDYEADGTLAFDKGSKVYVKKVGTADTTGAAIYGRQGSIIAVGTDTAEGVAEAIAQSGKTQFVEEELDGVLYVNASETIKGGVFAGGVPEVGVGRFNSVLFATENTLTVIDAATFNGTQLMSEGGAVELLGDVFIANAAAHQTLTLTSDDEENERDGRVHIDNIRLNASRILAAKVDGYELKVDVKSEEELANISGLKTLGTIVSHYDQNQEGGASQSAKFNEWLMQDKSINGLKDAEVVQAGNDVAGIGASAGMVSVTMDALSAFNDTVAQRTSILAPNAEGTTVWADVNGGRYEAKKLFNGAGYSSDIYAGVLGVDTVVSCGAKIGAALTVGTGDTDSKNTTAVTSMDSDFFGISVYTSKTFGDVANVAVDLGYMQGSNDVSVKAYDLGKFSADSDAFTLGVRGELLTKAGDFNVVPHAGLRWTRVSVDSFEAGYTTDIDNMNVFQLPVGVTVSGEFEGAGFTWAPAFDLSFVPAFGDKDADMTLGIAGSAAQKTAYGVQVIDSNPVQATLGIDATNGAWSFGLNYKLGVGTDSRMNNSFNANVRYTF